LRHGVWRDLRAGLRKVLRLDLWDDVRLGL